VPNIIFNNSVGQFDWPRNRYTKRKKFDLQLAIEQESN